MISPDDLTNAIVQAVAAATVTGAGSAASAAYEKFKILLKTRFGAEDPAVEALVGLEKDPQSDGRKVLLTEKISGLDLAKAPEVAAAAMALLDEFAQHGANHSSQTATGTNIAQADRGSTARVSVNDKT